MQDVSRRAEKGGWWIVRGADSVRNARKKISCTTCSWRVDKGSCGGTRSMQEKHASRAHRRARHRTTSIYGNDSHGKNSDNWIRHHLIPLRWLFVCLTTNRAATRFLLYDSLLPMSYLNVSWFSYGYEIRYTMVDPHAITRHPVVSCCIATVVCSLCIVWAVS